MKYVYPACFYPEKNGKISVVFVDFELSTFGIDLADAMYMAADAAAGRIISMLKDGEKLPLSSDTKTVRPDLGGFVSLVFIDTDELNSKYDDKLIKKTLTIPSWLNQAAERQNINFSATLKNALIEKIAQ
ncbi:MAG: HicB family protein [Treponema sp.]|nr:HicB family protein [Treponema sp.]